MTTSATPSLSLAVMYDDRVQLDSELRLTGIRTVWRFEHAAPGPDDDAPTVEIPYLVEFLGRGYSGRLDLLLQWRSGIGEVLASETHPLLFEAGKVGVRHGHTLRIGPRGSGLCWLELFLDGRFVTKIPAYFQFADSPGELVTMSLVAEDDHGGPYISIATFARVFEQTDADRIALAATTHEMSVTTDSPDLDDWGGHQVVTDLQACIRLIPGGVSGRKTGLVTWRHPNGRISDPEPVDLVFHDVIAPLNLRLNLNLDFSYPGTYELRLDIEGRRVCAIPLVVQPGLRLRSP